MRLILRDTEEVNDAWHRLVQLKVEASRQSDSDDDGTESSTTTPAETTVARDPFSGPWGTLSAAVPFNENNEKFSEEVVPVAAIVFDAPAPAPATTTTSTSETAATATDTSNAPVATTTSSTSSNSSAKTSRSIRVTGVGVSGHDGAKRHIRGGTSEDSFTAVMDILAPTTFPQQQQQSTESATSASTSTSPPTSSSDVLKTPRRKFHLFGAFDGHRSNHAARYCAKQLAQRLAKALKAPGVLDPQSDGSVNANVDDDTNSAETTKSTEDERIRTTFTQVVCKMDDDFCKRRWLSLVRDNGKKFYITRELEVSDNNDDDKNSSSSNNNNNNNNISNSSASSSTTTSGTTTTDPMPGAPLTLATWDASALFWSFLSHLERWAHFHGAVHGLKHKTDLNNFSAVHQSRWTGYKKELWPGATLCAVLVVEEEEDDEDANSRSRIKVFTANVGDSGALVYRNITPSSKDPANASGDSNSTATPRRWGGFKEWDKPVEQSTEPTLLPPGGIKLLTRPHKPSQPEELKRVCSTPLGFVQVQGLNVTMENYQQVAEHVKQAKARGQKV